MTTELAPGWRREYGRGMIHDKTDRFRIFRQGVGGFANDKSGACYLLEDRKTGKLWTFERQNLAIEFAEMVKKDEAHIKWVAERKKKIKKQVEFRHVTSAGGFYYWKDAATRKAERTARYDRDSRIIRRDNGDR